MAHEPCRAGKRLLEWLKEQDKSQTWFAAEVGVARAVLWRWIVGDQMPRLDFAAKIERVTEGAVPAVMWAPPESVASATGTDGG